MAEDYTSLLGRDSNAGFADIASAYLRSGSRKNKTSKKLLFASLFFNLREANMQSKVIKNLEQSDRDRIFDEAQVTNKWNAYNTLMNDDAEFKNNSKYFRTQAESKFYELNPNYDSMYSEQTGFLPTSAISRKQKEIDDYESALINLHKEKLKTGNVTKRLTKEEFFKPFEDYYVSEKERIASPQNISLVHKGINFLTGKKKEELTEAEILNKRNTAKRSNFNYLIDPDEITGESSIEMYRNPKNLTLTEDEAKLSLVQGIEDANLRREVLNDISEKIDPDTGTISLSKLQSSIIMKTSNFNSFIAKVDEAGRNFDELWLRDNIEDVNLRTSENLPDLSTPTGITYSLRRANFIDRTTGLGDEDTINLREKMYELQDLKLNGVTELEAPLVRALENDIRAEGLDRITLTVFNTVSSDARNPLIAKVIEEDYEGNEQKYIEDQMNRSLRYFNNIFVNPEDIKIGFKVNKGSKGFSGF
tara:strand:+ start:1459 stop:2886 length:1428 start_codon:yes stop_codon:yes gene_type:complete